MAAKQAVLLIHGIGEQRPMDTLRGFVNAVWSSDTSVHHKYAKSGLWSKPDNLSKGFELRRLTTSKNRSNDRTDFYEFYWAHMMQGTEYGHLLAWARNLLWRRPGSVPQHLRSVYWLLIAAIVVAAALGLYAATTAAAGGDGLLSPWVSTLLSVTILPVVGVVLKNVVGDAARYLHVAPANIQSRHEIRQAGVELLKSLISRKYDRIVVVGHSLGSVIGYDILYHTWAELHAGKDKEAAVTEALDKVEQLTTGPESMRDLGALREAQSAYLSELKTNGSPWCVSDFITLGSPLAHAAVLLSSSLEDLKSKQNAREFPVCPPLTETIIRGGQPVSRFSYRIRHIKGRVPHHAALFSATRWTNLYFPCRSIVYGDVVGGPLAQWFGWGIQDVPVTTHLRGGFLSHTLYWTLSKSGGDAHIDALRKAVNLLGE